MSAPRFELIQGSVNDGEESFMKESKWGEWVKYEDYEALREEADRLRGIIKCAYEELERADF